MVKKVALLLVLLSFGVSTSLFAQSFLGYSLGVGGKLFSSSYTDSVSSSSTTVTSAGLNTVFFWGSNLGFYSDVAIGVPISGSSTNGSMTLSQYNQLKLAVDEVGPIGYIFTPIPRLMVAVGGPMHVDAVFLMSNSVTATVPLAGWEGVGVGLSGQAIYRLGHHFGVYADASFGYDFFGITTDLSASYGGGYGWGVGLGVDLYRI